MPMVFTIWNASAVCGTGCFFPCFMLPSGALVIKNLVVMEFLSSFLSVKDFSFTSFMKLSLAGYKILG